MIPLVLSSKHRKFGHQCQGKWISKNCFESTCISESANVGMMQICQTVHTFLTQKATFYQNDMIPGI